jgi:hypothetical protein
MLFFLFAAGIIVTKRPPNPKADILDAGLTLLLRPSAAATALAAAAALIIIVGAGCEKSLLLSES